MNDINGQQWKMCIKSKITIICKENLFFQHILYKISLISDEMLLYSIVIDTR
jgi:hypothetical protein